MLDNGEQFPARNIIINLIIILIIAIIGGLVLGKNQEIKNNKVLVIDTILVKKQLDTVKSFIDSSAEHLSYAETFYNLVDKRSAYKELHIAIFWYNTTVLYIKKNHLERYIRHRYKDSIEMPKPELYKEDIED